MTHIHIFYFVLSLLIGISSMSILISIYLKDKSPLLKAFILFYTPFTLIVFLNFTLFYMKANLDDYHIPIFFVLDYIESPVSLYLLMFFLPYFFHVLFDVPNQKKRNYIIASFAVLVFVLYPFFNFLYDEESTIYIIGEYVEDLSFSLIFIYCITLGFIYIKNVSDRLLKKTIKFLVILMVIFIPGVYNDTFRSELSPIRFYPMLFWAISIGFTYYFFKAYLTRDSEKKSFLESDIQISNLDSAYFFENYNISDREKEVIELLLKGNSYQEIAEKLFLSVNTIKTHIRNIYPKLGINSRNELFHKFYKNIK